MMGAGLGILFCGMKTFSKEFERVVQPLMYPFMWISAIFFSTNDLPSEATPALLWNPLLHAVELTRMGWFRGYEVRGVSAFYPGACVIVLLFFGLTLERVARRKLEF